MIRHVDPWSITPITLWPFLTRSKRLVLPCLRWRIPHSGGQRGLSTGEDLVYMLRYDMPMSTTTPFDHPRALHLHDAKPLPYPVLQAIPLGVADALYHIQPLQWPWFSLPIEFLSHRFWVLEAGEDSRQETLILGSTEGSMTETYLHRQYVSLMFFFHIAYWYLDNSLAVATQSFRSKYLHSSRTSSSPLDSKPITTQLARRTNSTRIGTRLVTISPICVALMPQTEHGPWKGEGLRSNYGLGLTHIFAIPIIYDSVFLVVSSTLLKPPTLWYSYSWGIAIMWHGVDEE